MLFFRNLLRSDLDAQRRNGEANRAILSEQRHFERLNPWFSEYTDKKGAAVRRILRDSGFRTLRMVRPISPLEWQEASELLGLPDSLLGSGSCRRCAGSNRLDPPAHGHFQSLYCSQTAARIEILRPHQTAFLSCSMTYKLRLMPLAFA